VSGGTFHNRNRGYQKLRVWDDAVDSYAAICAVFRGWPYELRRVATHPIASADSVHRNIAEGYCRRTINEYIHHLYLALASPGECVSGLAACRRAGQIDGDVHAPLDASAFKIESGLSRLIESLEMKRERGDGVDHLMIRESNAACGRKEEEAVPAAVDDGVPPPLHGPVDSSIHPSATPALHHAIAPSLHSSEEEAPDP
jgi:four helix bundle protein